MASTWVGACWASVSAQSRDRAPHSGPQRRALSDTGVVDDIVYFPRRHRRPHRAARRSRGERRVTSHRRKYLLLNTRFMRRFFELHLEWIDEVETALEPDQPGEVRRRRSPRRRA
ncbi:MAG: hypothetical protein H0V26_11205 [Solirubrobacterales bacterium]|nr:hypothetical protein [Solirubrobacterales bacterium]